MTMFSHALAGAALTAAVVAVGQGGVALYKDWTSPPVPRSLALVAIEYKDGLIWQHIEPEGADAIAASWAAKVERGDTPICAGSGGSNYTGKPIRITPSAWTGSPCPEIQPGDRASATWEWRDAEGHIRSTSVEFELLPAQKRAGD